MDKTNVFSLLFYLIAAIGSALMALQLSNQYSILLLGVTTVNVEHIVNILSKPKQKKDVWA